LALYFSFWGPGVKTCKREQAVPEAKCKNNLFPNLFRYVKTLREATREQVENFVEHLADRAEKDRNALLCQLNSYGRPADGAA
jgi:hypothetical protein